MLTGGLWGTDGHETRRLAGEAARPADVSGTDHSPYPEPVDPLRTRSSSPSRAPALRAVTSDDPFVGRYVRAVPARAPLRDLAWDAMLRRVAWRAARGDPRGAGARPLRFGPDELLRQERHRRPARLLVLLVDISSSMGGKLMELARRLALEALQRAYLDRDRVSMIAFRAHSAAVLFGPTNQLERVHQSLRTLPLGGTTPLAAGLQRAHELLTRSRDRDSAVRQRLILISDGRANVGTRPGYAQVLAEVRQAAHALARLPQLQIVFLDTTEPGKHDLAARRLARQLSTQRIVLGSLEPHLCRGALTTLARWP